jgi:hypothetical protein
MTASERAAQEKIKRRSGFKDITGQQIGPLTVLEDAGDRTRDDKKREYRKEVLWLCRCSLCGRERTYTKAMLYYFKTGKSKSCGCLRPASPNEIQERIRARDRRRNKDPRRIADRRKASRRYSFVKSKALHEGLDFTITLDEYKILLREPCYYCGGDLPVVGSGMDRADNKLGYTLLNVRPCCKRCNIAKNNMTEEEFKEWLGRAYNTWKAWGFQ